MPTRDRWTRTPRLARLALALAVVALLAACGGAGPGGGNPDPTPTPADDAVAATLAALGINTSATPRLAPDGSELGDDDAPLGPSASLGEPAPFTAESRTHPHMELVIANPDIAGSTPVGTTFEVRKLEEVAVTPTGAIEFGSETILADLTSGNDWALPHGGNQYQTLRAVAAGDLDGDGLDEIAALFVDANDNVLKLRVFEDAAAGFTARTSLLAAGATVRGVALIAYDANGDGSDNLVAAISYADRVELVSLTGSVSGSFSIDAGATTTLDPQLAGSGLSVRMAAGQLDYDHGLELGVVVNERFSDNGLATYYLFDDANAGRALLRSGSVQANVGGPVTAAAADIKLADVDGDGLDEVILSGATNLAGGCSAPFAALLIAFDNAPKGFAQLGASVENLTYRNCSDASGDWRRLFVFLTTPDLDGDGVHEIVANQLVFDNFANAAPFTRLAGVELPASIFLNNIDDPGQTLGVGSMEMIAADVTGDGRQNVLLYHQNRTTMPVWGISAISSIGVNGWAQLSEIAMPGTANGQANARPIVVAANVDADGPVLKYGAGSHELVFTEPLIIAAMAAPPCQEGIQQNLGACVTRFGQGTSSSVDASLTVTVKASVTTGIDASVNVPFVGDVGVEMRKSVTATASAWAGAAYTVEKTVTYTSGSLEDAVVFTSIPYDVYRYDIVSHPDPVLVGMQVVIRMPREPVTMIAERTFFNAALPSSATPISANVFDHTPGDVSSYPSTSRKNALRSQYGGFAGLGFLEFGPTGVGQGSGDTELQIAVSNEISAGGSLGIEYEKTVEATSGVAMAGFSVGYGAEAALSITSGSQTTYTGIVGSISAADFGANNYTWGIFTYVQGVDGQKFEVINYWVE